MRRFGRHPRPIYPKLGIFLRNARQQLRDAATRESVSVEEIAQKLGVSKNFVYQVEKGTRKPKDGDFGRWSEVYGVSYSALWARLDKIPMDLVASLRDAEGARPEDPFVHLTQDEKRELLPFLRFVRWQLLRERPK